jgi:hypothetical protein
MFEAEATSYKSAGIQIGADIGETEKNLMVESLAPFSITLRSKALEMSRLYSVLFCFENEVRKLIQETLDENESHEWWENLSTRIKRQAETRKETAYKDSWLEGEKSNLLGFVDFGMLADIIISKWEFFDNIIPSQHWLKQRMDEIEKVRNFIAHNRMLLPSEFQRVYMYIADWNRVIGL